MSLDTLHLKLFWLGHLKEHTERWKFVFPYLRRWFPHIKTNVGTKFQLNPSNLSGPHTKWRVPEKLDICLQELIFDVGNHQLKCRNSSMEHTVYQQKTECLFFDPSRDFILCICEKAKRWKWQKRQSYTECAVSRVPNFRKRFWTSVWRNIYCKVCTKMLRFPSLSICFLLTWCNSRTDLYQRKHCPNCLTTNILKKEDFIKYFIF